jgi:predicted Zn-dependent protease with MMP-like domain
VREALETLPLEIALGIDNVAIEIAAEAPGHPEVLGLYEGVPLTRRPGHLVVLPDRITIFAGSLVRFYGHDHRLLYERTVHVVHHELAYHFGISGERLQVLQRY